MSARPLLAVLCRRKPFAARNWLKALRGLCQFAVDSGLLPSDPTASIKVKAPKSPGRHSWDEAQIQQFETRHPVGTRARLALALTLWTAQRRGDVVRLGRQHERNGVLSFTQQKTSTYVEIPLHCELRNIIDATPSGHLTYLVTETGKAFSAAGFGNWFAERCKEAGLPDKCRAHGLRKAMCRRLAEAGCSAPQISAISGHISIKEVQRYIEAANRKLMAKDGMEKAGSVFSAVSVDQNNHSQTSATGLHIEGKNR
jgi:integrase